MLLEFLLLIPQLFVQNTFVLFCTGQIEFCSVCLILFYTEFFFSLYLLNYKSNQFQNYVFLFIYSYFCLVFCYDSIYIVI